MEQSQSHKIIYLDQNIYGYISNLDTPHKRECFVKISAFSTICHRGENTKIVYNTTNIQEAANISGPKRNKYIKLHLNCLKSFTHGNYLIKVGDQYKLSKSKDPFFLYQEEEETRLALIEYFKNLLATDIPEDNRKVAEKVIEFNGDCNKAIMTLINEKIINEARDTFTQKSNELNNMTAPEVFTLFEDQLREAYKNNIDSNPVFREKYYNAFKTYSFISTKDVMGIYAKSDSPSAFHAAQSLLYEFIGYKALSKSELKKKPSSPLYDSLNCQYVIETTNIFVSRDKDLRDKLKDITEGKKLIFSLEEFIDYIENSVFVLEDKTIAFKDYYNKYLKTDMDKLICSTEILAQEN